MHVRILHTSDWHIGCKLKEHDRTEEFRKFFEWLGKIIARENVDALIVPGDIFDSRNPSAEAQEIYYSFLGEIAGKSCRHVVITSGNHDSAPFIDAPAGIMRRCEVHVMGCLRENEIITLEDREGRPGMIVCAVPFLRENDAAVFKPSGEESDKGVKIREAIMTHYSEIFGKALEIRGDDDIPIVAMGHLFLQAGKTQADEGERSIYLGTAPNVGTDIFPDYVAYTALGHLHSPQEIGRANIRYSGAPIHMTFGEWGVTKTVSIVDFDGRNFAGVREIEIPVWQKMARISGGMAWIESEVQKLAGMNDSVWAEVTYMGKNPAGDIQGRLEEIVRGTKIEVLSVIDEGKYFVIQDDADDFKGRTLDDIEPLKMLQRLMNSKNTPEDKRLKMEELYREILREIESE